MKDWCFIIGLLLIIQSDIMASAVSGFRNAEHGAKLAVGNAKFALDLYKSIEAEKGDKNAFFSPASISIALGMVHLGARNNSSSEMKNTMALSSLEDGHLHAAFNDLHGAVLKTEGNYTMHLANKLFIEQKYSLLQEFLDKTKEHYNAEATSVDFQTKFEETRSEINSWVEKQTNEKIKELMPPDSITALTRLVLVNAVYFKGNWAQQFDPQNTKPGDFKLGNGDKVTAQMMFQKKKFHFGFSKDLNCQVLELPYLGDKMSMFFLLPQTNTGLPKLTESLKPEHLMDPIKQFRMGKMEVHVTIPKFKVEMDVALVDILTKLGMKEIFSAGKADLSGMDGSRDLFVSAVHHKAFVEVNEEGSEAAAATGIAISLRSMPKRVEFKADRPFLYFIRENSTQSVIFMGAMKNPAVATQQKEEL